MRSNTALLLTLTMISVAVIIGACLLGSTNLPLSDVLAALVFNGAPGDHVIVWQIRLPRALAAFVVGAALGASGAALQGLLRNPLAEPGVLGVSASAALGATTVLYFGFISISPWTLPVASISAALVATTLLAIAATRAQSVVTLILVGVGLSSFAGALMSLLMNLAPHPFSLSDMINWLLGTVANRSFTELLFTCPFIFAGIALLYGSRRGLSALTLGEEAAAGVGLNLARQRIFVILGTGLATGGAVALAGAVGFVGIVAPHIVRPWVNHDPSRLVLPSALLAGIILVTADIALRVVPTNTELKLGVAAALLGAPVFVWIALQRRGIND